MINSKRSKIPGRYWRGFYPRFIDQDPERQTLSRLVDHIQYVCDYIGDDHIAFGADYDGIGGQVAIPPSHADLPSLTQVMLDRGFSESTIMKFWGGNFLRILSEAQDSRGKAPRPFQCDSAVCRLVNFISYPMVNIYSSP